MGYRVTRNGRWSPRRRPQLEGHGPQALTTYTYTVAALDGVGNVSTSASITVRTLADTQRPTKPANFRRVAKAGAYATFDWAPSVDNVGVAKYYVYRVGRS